MEHQIIDTQGLLALLHLTTLRRSRLDMPYAQARLALVNLDPRTLLVRHPLVSRARLRRVVRLADLLHSVAPGAVAGWLLSPPLQDGSCKGRWVPVLPPVVEAWPELGYVVCDGMHRVMAARHLGLRSLPCVIAYDVPYPLPVNHNAINPDQISTLPLVDIAPSHHTTEHNDPMYRDFHPAFPGIAGWR